MSEAIKRLMVRRQRAYKDLFRVEVNQDRKWYQFWKPRYEGFNLTASIVLADMRRFCLGTGSAFSTDPLTMAYQQGRRDVFERLRNQLHASDEEVHRFVEELEAEYE